MNDCVIFTGGELDSPERLDKSIWKNAFVIAADSGYRYAEMLGIIPDLAMGDYDSLGYVPKNCGEVMTFPKEKDDSDLMLAIREALKRGYKNITVIGALGGRFDHTFSVSCFAMHDERKVFPRPVFPKKNSDGEPFPKLSA